MVDAAARSSEESVPTHHGARRGIAIALMAGAVLLLLAAVIAGWMRVQLLDTDTWVETSRESLAEPDVSSAVSRYAVDQLFTYTEPQNLVRDAAPPRLAPLVGPATGALREAAYTAADRAMESEQLNQVWAEANRAAHERLVKVVEGDGEIVRETPEGLRLDVRPLMLAVAQRLGLEGKLIARIPESVTLIEPPNSAGLERSLETLRRLDRAAPLLAILAFVLLIAAVAVAPRGSRRSMVLVWGVSTLFAGILLGILRSSGSGMLAESMTDQPSWRDAIEAVYANATELLRLAARSMVLVGLVTIAGAWYVGESRGAVAARDVTVPSLRRHPIVAWAGLAVVAYVAFTRLPALESREPLGTLLLVVLLGIGFALVQREALRLVPEGAEPGPARHALGTLRARMSDSVTGEAAASTSTNGGTVARTEAATAVVGALPGDAAPDVSQRLERLDDLHRRGVLDDEEFGAAKRMLLAERSGGARPVAPQVGDGGSDGLGTT